MSQASKIPKYCHHKASGRAVVRLNGKDHYLGTYDSPESKEEYARLIAQWLAAGRQVIPESGTKLSVNEVLVSYLNHADGYYRKNGKPTKQIQRIRLSLSPVRKLYGSQPASEFGPLALQAVRQSMIEAGLCRPHINSRIDCIRLCFKWAASQELIPASVHHGLCSVRGLRAGRTQAREPGKILPVPQANIDAIQPFITPTLWDVIQFQLLTGARPGEALDLRMADINRNSDVWLYTPASHKTEHHGVKRVIFIGPRCQAVLTPYLGCEGYVFSPRESVRQFRSRQREARKSPVQPSQVDRSKPDPKRPPGERYADTSYRWAILRACDKAGVERWHPNRLRHSAATNIVAEYGWDVGRAVLGHRTVSTTQIYAVESMEKAMAAMQQIG